ncbi:DUF6263 family protein [Porphyromonadaceae bacterium OttesenSCG-928-L07]|nr:DUF6263 family protein [Porphyromonadaceae bacterium OttesenSCG-928-L07]
MQRILKITLLAIAVMLQYHCKSAPIEIKLNLEKGKEYSQTSTSIMTTKTGFTNEQTMDMTITLAGKISYLIEDVSDSAYVIEVRYKKLLMKMEAQQGAMTFDTENANDIMSTGLSFLVDNPFKIVLLKNGKVSSVDMTLFWGKIETSLAKFALPAMQQEQFMQQVHQAYGEKAFKGSFEQGFYFFPDKAVNKGEKWQIQIELYTNFSSLINSEYELAEIEKDCLTITGVSIITTDGLQDAIMPSSNAEVMKYDLTGTATSNIKVDRNTGWVIESNTKQAIKGKSSIGNLEMTMEMIGDLNITQ